MTTSAFLDDDDLLESRVESLLIPADGTLLEADLELPANATALVVFAHGSGSSRNSPRNRFVAGVLEERGLGTLLFDLLTPAETCLDAVDLRLRFDIELLAGRLCAVTNWLRSYRPTARLSYGCFGASTGAAAALTAAARMPKVIEAVVSRGGRPDLAQSVLSQVSAPTLLIVGGEDSMVLELNREAFSLLSGEKRLEIVEGATHLFEEPGTLEEVAELASSWFSKHLRGMSPTRTARPPARRADRPSPDARQAE